MSGGYEVVMGDLRDAAQTFGTEAGIFKGIMPAACVAPPGSGSGAFDGSLSALMNAITMLHLQISGDIQDNGTKLQSAHDNYQHTDETLDQLFSQISDPSKIK